MNGRFRKATKKESRLRLALDGPAGAGKTFTALRFAFAIGSRVAVIDSLSHAWEGTGGALDLVDRKQGEGRGNSFTAWKDVTPLHRKMVDTILASPAHVVATMRSRVEYVLETNDRGRSVPRRVGMAPVQRAGMEYEFDIYGSLDHTHTMTINKSRCSRIADAVVTMPGAAWLTPVLDWLKGEPEVPGEREFRQLTARMDLAKIRSRLKEAYGLEEFATLSPEQREEVLGKLRPPR